MIETHLANQKQAVDDSDDALSGASKSLAARGRDVFATVPAATVTVPTKCALPGARESRALRGRDAVATDECALPGATKPGCV